MKEYATNAEILCTGAMMESFIVSVVDVILIKDMQTYREWNMFSAAANGRCDIMKKLIDRGCDVNAKDSKGYTALYHADHS